MKLTPTFNTSIILWRDRLQGTWMATYEDGMSASLKYSSMEKAGTIAAIVAKANPNSRIGVRAVEFGPHTVMAMMAGGEGQVVWLRAGFEVRS